MVRGEWGSQKGESTGLASDFQERDFQNNLIKMLQNASLLEDLILETAPTNPSQKLLK